MHIMIQQTTVVNVQHAVTCVYEETHVCLQACCNQSDLFCIYVNASMRMSLLQVVKREHCVNASSLTSLLQLVTALMYFSACKCNNLSL